MPTAVFPALSPAVLLRHPTAASAAIAAVGVQVSWTADGALALAYSLEGDIGGIRVPAPLPAAAADRLWEHTCCEAFVAAAGEPGYREFNFSPSGQWAAYAFSGYRQRDESLLTAAVPAVTARRLPDRLELDAVVPRELLPAVAPGQGFELGLTAVVEAADGSRSYWALAHPGTQPDFHLRGAFTLALPAFRS